MIKQYTKQGKKYYKFRNIYIGIEPTTGKVIQKSKAGFKTKKEAELYIAKLRTEFNNGYLLNDNIITFKELFDLWYESYRHTVKDNSLLVSNSVFKIILKDFEKMQLKKITPVYCQKVLNKWYKKYKTYKKLKSYVINILNYAIDLRIINSNSMAITKTPKEIKEIKNDKELYYTKEELKHFFEILEKSEEYYIIVMFRLLAFTGIRKCELQALEWSDVDFTNNTININKTLAFDLDYNLIAQTPKSVSSIRKISIDKKTSKMLKKWKIQQKELLFKLGYKPTEQQVCFTNLTTNTYLNKGYLNNRINILCKKYDFKKIKIHGFRHTHCSLLFESGISIQEVQERLGHSDIKVTMNIYTHVTEKQKEEVGNKFQKYVNF